MYDMRRLSTRSAFFVGERITTNCKAMVYEVAIGDCTCAKRQRTYDEAPTSVSGDLDGSGRVDREMRRR
jgi:hypothetical protein